MTEKAFNVAVVGGGIGGLCLAQGSRKQASMSRFMNATGRELTGCRGTAFTSVRAAPAHYTTACRRSFTKRSRRSAVPRAAVSGSLLSRRKSCSLSS